jgi:hypothetical protein
VKKGDNLVGDLER